jgi:hypothetical protein
MYAAALAFALCFLVPLLHDNLGWIQARPERRGPGAR